MASRTTPMSNDWFSVLFTPISMLSKSTKTAIFSRGSVTKWSWEMGTCTTLTGRVDPPSGGEYALLGTDRGAPSRASAGRWPGDAARQLQSIQPALGLGGPARRARRIAAEPRRTRRIVFAAEPRRTRRIYIREEPRERGDFKGRVPRPPRSWPVRRTACQVSMVLVFSVSPRRVVLLRG